MVGTGFISVLIQNSINKLKILSTAMYLHSGNFLTYLGNNNADYLNFLTFTTKLLVLSQFESDGE